MVSGISACARPIPFAPKSEILVRLCAVFMLILTCLGCSTTLVRPQPSSMIAIIGARLVDPESETASLIVNVLVVAGRIAE